jgi:hypothetical protein
MEDRNSTSPLPSATDRRLSAVPNPFSDAAVGSVWDSIDVDVPRIHAEVSDRLLKMIGERERGHHHPCVMLYGDAGSGKTHVLRRLRMKLEEDRARLSPFSWVRMQTSPSMMWRHVRRNIADDLARRPFRNATQLQLLLEERRGRIEAVQDRDLAVVLEHLAEGRFLRDARGWLAGSSLPESALEAMGLPVPDAEEESAEDASRRVVYALAAFLAPAPLVLCLDQLEALQAHPGDKSGLFAIGKLLASLHDDVPNAVVIGCVQVGLVAELSATLSRAEQDRYRAMGLRPLDSADVRALVGARLSSSRDLAALRPAAASEFWPIQLSRLDPLIGSREGVTARRIIFECEQMFREAQSLPLDTTSLEDRLAEKLEERAAAAAAELSADTSASVLSDALPRLLHLRGASVVRPRLPKWIDHVSVAPDGHRTGVVVANEPPRTLWRKLDRIAREWDPGEYGLVIIRDAMNPLKPTAAGSTLRLRELERRGARVTNPSREVLVALDAVRRLLADVESGDLTYRGEKIGVATVEDWVRRNLGESAADLLDQLSGPATNCQEEPLRRELAAYLSEHKLASVAEAASALESTPRQVENCAYQNPDQFGILAGIEPVVFEKIPPARGS